MNISSKRAEYVALTGLVLSIIFFLSACVIGAVSRAFAVWALSWQILAGALIWLVLVIVFHQRSLAEQEKLDMMQLAHQGRGHYFSGCGRAGGIVRGCTETISASGEMVHSNIFDFDCRL